MRLRRALLLFALAACGLAAPAAAWAGLGPAGLKTCLPLAKTRAEADADRAAERNLTAYTLPPDKLRKAIALHRIDRTLAVAAAVWTPFQLLLLLSLGIVARIRDAALRLSSSRWAQGFAFVFLLLLAIGLLDLPLAIYGHHIALDYGLSVQGWASWLGDKVKLFALEWGIGGLLARLVFRVIRRSPTRWWLWLWAPAALLTVAGIFVTPYLIDPLFNRFEPLAQSNPALVAQLEQVVSRSGIAIPPERMFLMRASDKYTGLNAYVTGFGASKRIVVWDTTIAQAMPDEIAFVFAHEMGHYALGHVVAGVALACAGLLPFFWLGYHGMRLLLGRYGTVWRIPAQQDWAALAVLLLVLSVVSTFSEPIANAVSRSFEHSADIYAQEAVHGIVANPQSVGRRSFQELGEQSFDDPTHHPFFDFWFGTHPPIWFRSAFAEAYNPWAPGLHPKYFSR